MDNHRRKDSLGDKDIYARRVQENLTSPKIPFRMRGHYQIFLGLLARENGVC